MEQQVLQEVIVKVQQVQVAELLVLQVEIIMVKQEQQTLEVVAEVVLLQATIKLLVVMVVQE
ncbi:MAG: hypothetical protein CME98_23100 [Hyphomonas sp.]|nr:hypothetical protein [Hyphomonas sp.]